MKKIKSILFPTDYSQFSNDTIEYAIAFAMKFGAKVYIMHVVELSTKDPANPMYKKPRLEDYTDIHNFVKSSTAKQLDGVRFKARKFQYEEINIMGLSAGREIAKAAGRKKADLIIMASHGAGFFEKLLLGSTTEMVIKEAPCPVLVTKKGERDFVDFKKDEIKLRTILCPIDFSRCSIKAVQASAFLASKLKAEVVLLNVIEDVYRGYETALKHFKIGEFEEKIESAVRKHLEDIAEKFLSPEIEHRKLVLGGSPRKAIVDYAKEKKIDLIVLGAYGRGEEDGTIFSGSVALKVVKTADCPVLLIR